MPSGSFNLRGDHSIMVDVEKIIQKTVVKYIDPASSFIFLFGSRALRTNRPQSDYDVGIYTGQKISLTTIAKIKDDLEEYPIPVDIDVVDFAKVSEEFKAMALKEVQLWNTPKTNLKLI